MLNRFCWLLFAALFFLVPLARAAQLDPIVIKGSHFFLSSSGNEFFINGIVYQQDIKSFTFGSNFVDPLQDVPSCNRDIPYLRQLGVNVVRLYAVNGQVPTSAHDACMQLLADAGIYVLVDLSTPSTGIDRTSPSWNLELYNSYTATIDNMAGYTNVLGFIVGSEVINGAKYSGAATAVKAAVRDMKAYIKAQNYRQIGVGYVSSDILEVFDQQMAYFNCGDPEDAVDFYGLNVYSWCGDSSLRQSGYSNLVESFGNYSVPVFFAEYGCNTVQPRTFSEVQAIYNTPMTDVFSGGVVYMYFEDPSNYGIVNISNNDVTPLPEFEALSSQIASIKPPSTSASDYKVTNTAMSKCPSTGSSWSASPTLPPTPYSEICNCMMASLSCVATTQFFNLSLPDPILGSACGSDPSACHGIQFNYSTGTYGAYSMCNITQQVSWAMNQFYLANNKNASRCFFGGNAEVKEAEKASPNCEIMLNQAGVKGAGTITSTPSPTGPSTSSPKEDGQSVTITGLEGEQTSPGGVQDSHKSRGGGLSTGAKAGIAISAVLFALSIIGLGFFFWRSRKNNKSKKIAKPNPLYSGEGGLEVGDAPSQYTALRAAEMAAISKGGYQFIKPNMTPESDSDHVYDIPVADSGRGAGELEGQEGRRELDGEEGRRELEGEDGRRELEVAVGSGAIHAELSGESERKAELASTTSHRRKPVAAIAGLGSEGQRREDNLMSPSWSNTPWSEPGPDNELPAVSPERREHIPIRSPSRVESPSERDEMLRMEEEERRIDEAIAESERLQALRKEKEYLKRRMDEARARKGGGGGGGAES